MATPVDEMRREAAEAVNEATRTAAETSRRAIEHMQMATSAGRGWLEESSRLSRKLYTVWACCMEATLKAGFEMQNAALTASIPVYDTAFQQWVTLTRQAQEAALEGLRTNVRMMEKVALGAMGEETAAH
jgi:hypothetical protein